MLYKERETNVARKLGVSTVTLRNWVGLKNTSLNDDDITMQPNTPSDTIDFPGSEDDRSFGNEIPNFYAALDEPTGIMENAGKLKYTSAHCLHQNIETLTLSLHDKIDALQ